MWLLIPVCIGAVVGVVVAVFFHRQNYPVTDILYGIVGALSLRLLAFWWSGLKEAQPLRFGIHLWPRE